MKGKGAKGYESRGASQESQLKYFTFFENWYFSEIPKRIGVEPGTTKKMSEQFVKESK